MRRKLTTTGTSRALTITRDMLEHLGITDEVEVSMERGRIVLTKPPMSMEEALSITNERYAEAFRELAKGPDQE